MKHEWRKAEKETYLAKARPVILEIPEMKFITITGKGNPNHEEYAQRIAALYPIAYNLRFKLKRGELAGGPFEYTVYPLEGLWTQEDYDPHGPLNKDLFVYKLMIRQPNQVTHEDFLLAQSETLQKSDHPFVQDVAFESYTEGKVVQMMHHGPYDDEVASFAILEAFMAEYGLERQWIMDNYVHREIYLNDPRRVAPEKYKTTLRLKVQEKR